MNGNGLIVLKNPESEPDSIENFTTWLDDNYPMLVAQIDTETDKRDNPVHDLPDWERIIAEYRESLEGNDG